VVVAERAEVRLTPDPTRVIALPFMPGSPAFRNGSERVRGIVERVAKLPDDEVDRMLERARSRFEGRHASLDELWETHAGAAIVASSADADAFEGSRRSLLGAYFTYEYALEAAAVCNPSMVPHPNDPSGRRFVMSVRAIGEGHISSVELRTGSIEDDGTVVVDDPHPTLRVGAWTAPIYEKQEFSARLDEMGPDPVVAGSILDTLGDSFTVEELDRAIDGVRFGDLPGAAVFETARLAHWVAVSNYERTFDEGPLSERVLFPASPADQRGIEDVRFVRFVDDDEAVTYFGTYTAYDGYAILPQLISTKDFRSFRFSTLSGPGARNKGMALFPRRIDGRFVALGRFDKENLYLMHSDRVRRWNEWERLHSPSAGWELLHMGNCGSPIETERGWLVITHGVGPMREYSIGAMLLDLEDPSRIVGMLDEPLLEPAPDERDGYVPNVVYSCGGYVHGGRLILPYGISDREVGIATVVLDDLLDALASR
jgi:predicted GH43/DUF377 family glycosyl hydrolase